MTGGAAVIVSCACVRGAGGAPRDLWLESHSRLFPCSKQHGAVQVDGYGGTVASKAKRLRGVQRGYDSRVRYGHAKRYTSTMGHLGLS